ncbi:MAG: peptidyl-alpha-hydroxyglycine alpha-amidating lyase family protein [Vicinamibacterales bacterium]|nr:peptidyl-alpha-hydroxyglycine alpha-amidating lyase family protein [Vicinamibacterales bacterium]
MKNTIILACVCALGVVAVSAQSRGAMPVASTSAGPQATSCGNPASPAAVPAGGRGAEPIFPAGQYPVQLPAKSLLGAPNDAPNPFMPGFDWGQLPEGRKWGSTASVTTAPDGTIWVTDRCGKSGAGGELCNGASAGIDPIFQFDTSGKMLKSFGKGMFTSPHKLTVDKDGNLWMADNGQHQVMKLDQNGKVLLTLGKKGVVGTGHDEFDAPTEVAIAPNGDIFVADGHTGGGLAGGNARIVKFDKDGKFIKTWGRKGMGPGEFDAPHTLAFDSRGRLFVGDRQNNRIQIFDQDGKFIAQWFQFGRPSGIYIDKRTDMLYVADSESRDARNNFGRAGLPATGYSMNIGARRGIRVGSARDGAVKYFIPDPCPYPYAGGTSFAEGVTADAEGNVYGADNLTDVRKFILKK